MNTKKFMEAVGNINDENIAKYAEISPVIVKGKAEKEVKGMKKLSVWLSAAAACLVLGAAVFGITRIVEKPIDTHEAAVPTPVPMNDFTEGHDVPEQIIFTGFDDYCEFASAIKLEDKEFQEFLENNGYDMNGVNNKEDAIRVLNTLESMPFPLIKGYSIYRVALRFDLDNYYVLYRNEEEGLYLGFDIRISNSEEDAIGLANELDCDTVEIPLKDSPEFGFLLRVISNDDSNPNSYYFTNYKSHRIRLITNMEETVLVNLLRVCTFGSIGDYAE